MNYYNEFDPNAAAWLRQLIADKQIPNGTVDDRSITEVTPNDLKGFTQCHFFAGVGGWSLALRLAGVPENRRIWTASLPCQPFSTAGKQLGTDDERHLAPVFLELVRQCNPPVLFGEQVASKIARTQWLPGIRLELEALGYSFGAVDLSSPCAGEIGEGRIVRGDQESWERVIIGKPHIRQRLYWVSSRVGNPTSSGPRGGCEDERGQQPEMSWTGSESVLDGLADSDSERRVGIYPLLRTQEAGADGAGHLPEATGCGEVGGDGWKRVSFAADCLGGDDDEPGDECSICGLIYADDCECPRPTHDGYEYAERDGVLYARWVADSEIQRRERLRDGAAEQSASPRNSDIGTSSSDHVLLPCRDGKTRRTQFGIFPLVAGIPRGVVPSGDPGAPEYANATAEARAARLKGYGNAIQIDTAVLFIQTAFEALADTTP